MSNNQNEHRSGENVSSCCSCCIYAFAQICPSAVRLFKIHFMSKSGSKWGLAWNGSCATVKNLQEWRDFKISDRSQVSNPNHYQKQLSPKTSLITPSGPDMKGPLCLYLLICLKFLRMSARVYSYLWFGACSFWLQDDSISMRCEENSETYPERKRV